jgi:hypothetical protein
MNQLEKHLEKLRQDWKRYPSRRKAIEIIAKNLKKKQPRKLIDDVKETLL